METLAVGAGAAGAGDGGGAGLVVSDTGCCASSAQGRARARTAAVSLVIGLHRPAYPQPSSCSTGSEAALRWPVAAERTRAIQPTSRRLCTPSAGNLPVYRPLRGRAD